MRLYLKLLLLIAIFVCAAQRQLWKALSEVAYDVRVAYVCAFGSAADMDRLIDETQRDLARQEGSLDTYVRGKLFQQLLQQRLVDAAARGIRLGDDDIALIREECQMEAFGRGPAPSGVKDDPLSSHIEQNEEVDYRRGA